MQTIFGDKLLVCGAGFVVSILLAVVVPDNHVRRLFALGVLGFGAASCYFGYRRFTATATDKLYEGGPPDLPFDSPWSQEDRSAPNKAEMIRRFAGIGTGALGLLAITVAEQGGDFLFALWLSAITFLLFGIGPIWRMFLYAKWKPTVGDTTEMQLQHNGTLIRADGTSASFKLLKNYQFIDVWVKGRLVDCFRIVSLKKSELELQGRDGKSVKFKRVMTAGEALLMNPLSLLEQTEEEKRDRRLSILQEKWEPVNGDGPAIQFTDDKGKVDEGAYIRFDGFAARYSFAAKAPFDTITIHYGDDKIALKILSLERDELVLTGDGRSVHYKRGVSISAAQAKKRADAFNEKLKTVGKAALATVGVIGAGIAILGVAAAATTTTTCSWCGFTRSGLHMNCPGCGRYS